MAEALKIEGNVHVAAREWGKALECYSQALTLVDESDSKRKAVLLSNRSWCLTNLNRLKEAVEDGQLCIKLQPGWSKSYLRCAQAYSKQCNYAYANLAYSEAIRTAETPTIRAQYVAARKLIEDIEARRAANPFRPLSARALIQTYGQTWIQRVMAAKAQGYQIHEGAISMMIDGWNSAHIGWLELDSAIYKSEGEIGGLPGSLVSQKLADSMLLDNLCFAIPTEGALDPSYSFGQKFFDFAMFQWTNLGLLKYFTGRRWTAAEIVRDFDSELSRLPWPTIMVWASTIIRGIVLEAFKNSAVKDHALAINDLRLAIEIVEEGNKIWPDVPRETKGSSFSLSHLRLLKTQLMHYCVEANQMAYFGESAAVAFSLENIEEIARDLSANTFQAILERLTIMPTAHAQAALGYAASRRAQAPLNPLELKVGTAALADLENAKKAARCYDLAYKLFPNDYYGKPSIGFKALEMHLLAGGKTVKEVLGLAEEAEKIRKDLVRFFVHLDEEDPARTFVEGRIQALRDWLKSPSTQSLNGVAPINLVLRASPTLNIGWENESIDMDSLFTPEYWSKLPGDVGIVIKAQLYAFIDGKTARINNRK